MNRSTLAAATLLIALPGFAQNLDSPNATDIDASALRAADLSGAQWLSYGRDHAETRFSPLEQIDASNVSRLGMVWYYDTKSLRVLEATPLIADGVLYGTTSWSNVFAVAARTGDELWYTDV